MTISDDIPARPWRRRANWLRTPTGALVALLIAAAALRCVSPRITDPVRDGWMLVLKPAMAAADDAVSFSRGRFAWLQAAMADGQRVAEVEGELDKLKAQNERLSLALDAARLSPSPDSGGLNAVPTEPLLESHAIAARVLGRAAQTFLRGRELLDFGSSGGAAPGALVIDSTAAGNATTMMIDAGRDLGVQPGRIVLAGRRVWGKLTAVGSQTSVVRRITDPGYRDTVQIAHGDAGPDGPRHLGPRGVLVGSGERLCRIELVEASDPISEGDDVYTESDGLLPEPLVYGRIVRVELADDKLHWQIWMQPAASDEPRNVAVLRAELNQARVGMVRR